MAVKLEATTHRYLGLSTDEKPLTGSDNRAIATGSSFLETDTGNIYRFDGTHWRFPVRDRHEQAQNDEMLAVLYRILASIDELKTFMMLRLCS